MKIEGVTYHRYTIRFRLAPTGRLRRWVRWAPAKMYVRESLIREFVARGIEPEHLTPGSCTISGPL